MEYICNGCKTRMQGAEIVKQTLSVPSCANGYHAGPYEPVLEGTPQTRPEPDGGVRWAVER